MNLILLKSGDFISENIACLSDFRFEHIKKILKLRTGENVKTGLLGGKIGDGEIIEIGEENVKLRTNFYKQPPERNPAILFCALPRPKVFRRVLLNAATFGVKETHFFHSLKVEKSYWQSPFLSQDSINEIVENALMQSVDTVAPQVCFHKFFKPFVEDVFAQRVKGMRSFVFHPSKNSQEFDAEKSEKCCVVIGAEGGFSDFEIETFEKCGVKIVSIGERILRVEQVVSAVLGRF